MIAENSIVRKEAWPAPRSAHIIYRRGARCRLNRILDAELSATMTSPKPFNDK